MDEEEKTIKEEENCGEEKSGEGKKHGPFVSFVIRHSFGCFVVLICLIAIVGKFADDFWTQRGMYREARALMEQEEYRESRDLLEELMKIQDRAFTPDMLFTVDEESYYYLCDAHINYEEGYIGYAYRVLNEKCNFDKLDERTASQAEDLKTLVNRKYPAWERKQEREEQAKKESEKAKEEEEERKKEESLAESRKASMNEYRERQKKKKSSSSSSSDSYNAKSYSNADDFYYDNYNDFYDYEDAEDYWENEQ